MNRNFILVALVAVILLGVVAVFGWETRSASASATNNRLQTATVQRGTLVATISAAGNVSAPQQAAISFGTGGIVAKVPVQLGDQVKKGQLLMQLDTTDLTLALKTAQANLTSAQANRDQTLNDQQTAIKTAQASLATAQANYDDASQKNAQNPSQVIAAKATLDKANAAVQTAQAAYDKIGGASNPASVTSSQAVSLTQATDDAKSALANYNIAVANANDATVRAAQASLDSAKLAVQQAQSNLDGSTKTTQATLDSAMLAVDQAQQNVDKASIYAPFDGVISQINYSAGDSTGTATSTVTGTVSGASSSSSVAITIVNLSNLQVQVPVAEVDEAKLKVGQTAQVTMDALPGKTFNARVESIGPAGTVTQGVVNYPVTLTVDNSDGSIRPGMTANLAIAIDQRSNVLTVPTRAVRTQGNQKVVTVIYKGQSIQTPVNTGLANDQSVEITSGLQEGDLVVINQTQPAATNVRGGGLPFVGGFGR